MRIFLKSDRLLPTFFLLAAMIIVPLFLINCGSSSTSTPDPDPDPTYSVMITPATLNDWVTNGYTTEVSGYNKMVILSVDSDANYAAGHVPGAYLLHSTDDLKATRFNGVSDTISQVATKAQMDALIQRTGIDADTVVVFAGATSMMNIGRAYFNFRYWGFPKSRLRVMNGTNNTYVAAGYTLDAITPTATPTAYSVSSLTQNTSVRASLEDMIAVAEDSDASTIVLDTRSAGEYDGSTAFTEAFTGHVKTAVHQEWTDLVVSGGDGELLSATELKAVMALNSVSSTDTTYSYCRTSWRAAVTFLALDASLGWDTKIYDGAWIQWGQMAGISNGGALDDTSPWLTDTAARSGVVAYNAAVVPLAYADSDAPGADAINQIDTGISADSEIASVMVSPSKVNDWVTSGYSDPYGYTKMIVLSVDTAARYADPGHVTGALLLDTAIDLKETRSNGIANTVSMVPTKALMDAFIQSTGIDADTVVVFTGGGSSMTSIGRGYFNFRYWGFPKHRLRVMNGTNTTYTTDGYTLEATVPTATPSTYDVCELPQDTSVRASLEEMIGVAEDSDDTTIVLDTRSAGEYDGSTADTGRAFTGHIKTAVHQEYTNLHESGGFGAILSATELEAIMAADSVTSTDTTYAYCKTSWRAAVTFLALDASLGWDTKIYDGAWSEWGQMAGISNNGSLADDNAWLTDTAARSGIISYTVGGPSTPLEIDDANAIPNLIATTDAAICSP